MGVTPEGVATVAGLDAPVLVDAAGAYVVDLGVGNAEAGEDVAELVEGAGGDARHEGMVAGWSAAHPRPLSLLGEGSTTNAESRSARFRYLERETRFELATLCLGSIGLGPNC